MKKIVFNVKPSRRINIKFKKAFPNATYYGAAVLGGKSKSYLLTETEYNINKETLKKYGGKAKHQPFI